MALREEVAVRAAWGLRKVRRAIAVTTEAHLALEPGRVAVPRVTALAGLMLGFVMQAGQRRGCMATAACRRLRGAVGPVGTVTTRAALAEPSVRRAGFRSVAAGAALLLVAAVVRLVAVGTSLVTQRRAGVLGLMALTASDCLITRVRLVTTGAVEVTAAHGCMLPFVATAATAEQRRRPVRQTPMATFAVSMTCVARDLLQVIGVAVSADAGVNQRDAEVVRLVTLGALDALVSGVVVRGELMAAAAAARGLLRVARARVSIVTADASSRARQLRMIGVDLGVTALTRALGAGLYVVGGVAAGAAPVCGDVCTPEHGMILVA